MTAKQILTALALCEKFESKLDIIDSAIKFAVDQETERCVEIVKSYSMSDTWALTNTIAHAIVARKRARA